MADEVSAGVAIRRARQLKRMTQRDLAAALKVSPSTVANWETGKHLPRRYQHIVEAALGIDLENLAPAS